MATKTEKDTKEEHIKIAAKADKAGKDAKEAAPAKKASSRRSKAEDNYTDPQLRERLKDKIMAGDKGGKPGQWSARKAQLLKQEYEKEGGGYKSNQKTESQKDLEKWTDEKWQTSDGKEADRPGGTTRYLPEEAWDKLSPAEKKATNAKKQAGSKKGEQRVANTKAAGKARKEASE